MLFVRAGLHACACLCVDEQVYMHQEMVTDSMFSFICDVCAWSYMCVCVCVCVFVHSQTYK